MKESFTIVKPLIAEDFVSRLKKKMNETENGEYLISHDDLNECVGELARNIMTRERYNFDRYLSQIYTFNFSIPFDSWPIFKISN